MNNPIEPIEWLLLENVKPTEVHKYRAYEITEVHEIEKHRDDLRTALLQIRKIRRNKFMPDHEEDEIYNIATNALNGEKI